MPDLTDLFADAFRLLREHMTAFVAVVAAATAAGIAFDLAPLNATVLAMLLFSLLNLYLQAFLTASALGLAPARTAGRYFASIFGLSFISSIGILIGFVLLVIPGLLLILRWSVSLPVLLAEDAGVTESLSRSWRLTGSAWWLALPVVALFLLAFAPQLVLVLLALDPETAPIWLIFLTNGFTALVLAYQWLFVAALYQAIRDEAEPKDLPAIFS